ncbi:hypothetical protein AI27_14655 [Sphingomonas sp. BHC-A]|nr:hypothetical protein AI27_14655 [Sphingomonas sp. BHC-A]
MCAFLKSWKSSSFQPPSGALVVLSTRKEIESCIHRADLEPCDFAVLVQKGLELNERGRPDTEGAPVLFTTQEMLRRLCHGGSFAEAASLHFQGRPRVLRVWDEAFLPSSPATIRKDTLVSALEELRPIHPAQAEALEALAAPLEAASDFQAVEVPTSAGSAYMTLRDHLGLAAAERWAPLQGLAGRQAVTVNGGSKGLYLSGGGSPLPEDFAPALILDASGRVRETYKAMEAIGLLLRLPATPTDYSRLTLHHWDRAASRSTLKDPRARREIMAAAASIINASAPSERWLIIHPKARASDGFDAFKDLCDHVACPERLAALHWGNHHGTNEYRDIRKVMVLGLWTLPQPAYTALHLAAGGTIETAADKGTIDAIRAGEHKHNLLQAICRASVRQGSGGVCGECEVFLIGKLGPNAKGILQETFPAAEVVEWTPEDLRLKGSALRVAQELERCFGEGGLGEISKAALRAALGLQTTDALAKVLRRDDFRTWADRRGIEGTTRALRVRRVPIERFSFGPSSASSPAPL